MPRGFVAWHRSNGFANVGERQGLEIEQVAILDRPWW